MVSWPLALEQRNPFLECRPLISSVTFFAGRCSVSSQGWQTQFNVPWGVGMGRFKNLLFVSSLSLVALSLTSCTLKRPCPLCGGGGGGGGNTTGVSATLAAVPLTPPPGTN